MFPRFQNHLQTYFTDFFTTFLAIISRAMEPDEMSCDEFQELFTQMMHLYETDQMPPWLRKEWEYVIQETIAALKVNRPQ